MSAKVLLTKPCHLVLIVSLVLCLIQVVLASVSVASTKKLAMSVDQKNAERASIGSLVTTLLLAPMLAFVLYKCIKLPSAPSMLSSRF